MSVPYKDQWEYKLTFNNQIEGKKMRSYFIIIIGIILFLPSIVLAEETNKQKGLSWFKKENLSIRASVFGGRTRHSEDMYIDFDYHNLVRDIHGTSLDRFWFDGRTNSGSEFGISYKIGYGIELGLSYMIMELNDYHGKALLVDSGFGDKADWWNTVNMDIDSRAIMFNTRVYLDDLTGIKMGRFSPYILGGVGRATHDVTDLKTRGAPALNGVTGDSICNYSTSHNNKGQLAYRLGLGTLFRLTDHISIDASGYFMDWGKARTGRYYQAEGGSRLYTMPKPFEPDVRTIQGSVGIQINLW